MERRKFATVMGAVAAGMAAGSRVFAADAMKADDKAPKHICKGHNDCKGQGGCAADAAKHDCKGKNECKGMGGCKAGDNGCAGKNGCKGKGGCSVPVKAEHMGAAAKADDKTKHSCSGPNGCGGADTKKK
jgi:hypothetical protein